MVIDQFCLWIQTYQRQITIYVGWSLAVDCPSCYGFVRLPESSGEKLFVTCCPFEGPTILKSQKITKNQWIQPMWRFLDDADTTDMRCLCIWRRCLHPHLCLFAVVGLDASTVDIVVFFLHGAYTTYPRRIRTVILWKHVMFFLCALLVQIIHEHAPALTRTVSYYSIINTSIKI